MSLNNGILGKNMSFCKGFSSIKWKNRGQLETTSCEVRRLPADRSFYFICVLSNFVTLQSLNEYAD